MRRVVGIDLGTTTSVVAVLDGSRPTVVPNRAGARNTPSVVGFAPGGEMLVGQRAVRQAVTHPHRTVASAKRHLGTRWLSEEIDGARYSAQEIVARLLLSLKRDAEAHLGDEVRHAVLAVPVGFGDAQRQAIKDAGQIAGLDVLRIINAPTAAALTYGNVCAEEQLVLVLDLGGGTIDVSLLEIGDGVVEVKATSGDDALGGEDWDRRIVEWLEMRFARRYREPPVLDRRAVRRLWGAATDAKTQLSTASTTPVVVPYLYGDAGLDEELSRGEFEEMTADLLHRTRGPVSQVFRDARVSPRDVDQVLLVGGPPGCRRWRRSSPSSSEGSRTGGSTPKRRSRWVRPSRPACSSAS